MSDQERQKKLLALLLVVLAGAVAYRVLQGGGGGGGGGVRVGRPEAVDGELAAIDMPHLDLEALQRAAAEYAPGRDPFRFGAAPAPAQPPRQVAPKPPPQRAEPKPRPRPANQPARPPKPQPPPVDITYLGSFGPQERRIAVFAKDEQIFNALVGDVLLNRFIIDKIGFESADIKFVGFPDAPEARLEAGG